MNTKPEPIGYDPASARGLGAATVHEAFDMSGALPSEIKPVADGMRVCGPAYPIRCPPGDNLRLHEAIYLAAPGSVLVVDVGGAHEFGYWGEITTVAAQTVGIGGLVIDGGVRDTERIAALAFPVFSRGVCIQGTVKNPLADGSVGLPITIGGVGVELGDLVVGDADGVAVVVRARAAEVIARAHAREAAEIQTLRQIAAGERTIDRIRRRLGQ